MSSVSPIAISGIVSASVRIQETARRIANIASSDPFAYSDSGDTPQSVDGTASSGVAQPFQSDARSSASYGLLSGPSVNLAGEIIEQLTASTTFMAVAQVIRADSKMIEALLDIKV